MIPRFRPSLDWREIAAALTPPRRDDVERFERSFADLMGQKHAVAFPYGRTGLMLLLEALGLKGKEIICPAYTCVVVPHAIIYSGNTPVFVDCKEGEFNMDLDRVPEVITERTGAIIATSLFGYPVDLDRLADIRKRYPHIKIIQDCAHSFSAEWKGRPMQREGDAAIFGLNISKIITSIFGGMVTTDDDRLADSLRLIRSQRLKKPEIIKSINRFIYFISVYPAFWGPLYSLINVLERLGMLDRFVKYYDDDKITMPADFLDMLTPLEARVGVTQVRKYHQIVSAKRANARAVLNQLSNIPDVDVISFREGCTYSHVSVLVGNRHRWLASCMDAGVQIGILIEYSIPYMKAYRTYGQEAYPVSKYCADHVINIPNWRGIDIEDLIQRVIACQITDISAQRT